MALVATPLVPSTTNSVGVAFGTFVGGVAVKWLVAAPFVLKLAALPVAAFLGLTPMGIAGIGGVIVTALGTYAATHIAELQEAGMFLQAIKAIKAQQIFPTGKNGDETPPAQTPNNLNKDQSATPTAP